MIFREAKLNDIPKLKELEQGVIEAERPFDSMLTLENTRYYDLNDLITNPNSCLIVCEKDQEIVASGYAQIRISKEYHQHELHSYLGFMFVSPELRGQNVIKSVIDRLISWSESKQVTTFILDVYSENISAIKAYQKCGFKASLLEMRLETK